MNTLVRNHTAALLLLLPAAGALVGTPAAAQQPQRAVVSQPSFGGNHAQVNLIERFVVRGEGRMQPGQELRFRLHGIAGGDAWLDIPGVISGVDLRESRPGVYEGEYTIRRRDDLAAFPRATATLQHGNRRATARVDVRGDDRPVARDERAPTVSDLAPADGDRVRERGRTHVFARIADEGSGVEPGSVRLRVDGRDVTRDVRVQGDEVHYRADFSHGRHTAELTLRDRAGNTATRSWSFMVVDRDRGERGDRDDRRSAAPVLPLTLTSHGNGAVVESRGNMLLQGRTAPNANVRIQVESVGNLPGGVDVSRVVTDQYVQADASGNFHAWVNARSVVAGNRYEVKLTATSDAGVAEHRVSLVQRQG